MVPGLPFISGLAHHDEDPVVWDRRYRSFFSQKSHTSYVASLPRTRKQRHFLNHASSRGPIVVVYSDGNAKAEVPTQTAKYK